MVNSVRPTVHAGHAGACPVKGQGSCTFLSPKACVRLGCWNVRSLGKPTRQNARLREVLRTMDEKCIRQIHSQSYHQLLKCPSCGQCFKQGLHNHLRFCS